MDITIIKDAPDPRLGRSKTISKGKKLTVTSEFGNSLIKQGEAKLTEPEVKVLKKENTKKE